MFSQHGRRASRACVSCHQRKLRCDASFRGCPCTRCLQDGKETCILREKLPRFSRNFYQNVLTGSPTSDERPTRRADDAHTRDATPPGSVDFSRYSFLELNNLQALDKEDVSYLRSKGCFSLPEQPALDEFITKFFLHTHPQTPVLDEAKFWRVYLQRDGPIQSSDQKISLFVFHAMLFMACSDVSLETIQKCGFTDKETARASFYKRAKLLFDLRAENSPLNKAQGSVLLSHQVSPDDPQTGSLWLVYATQNTVILGQQPVSFAGDLRDAMKKRLWWSILLRDRCLCLGLRRRTQITSKHFNAETSYLEEADFADEISNSHVYDKESKQILFETLQHQCRLAVLVTDMATFMFTTNGVSSPSLSFKAFQSHRCEIKRLRNELLQWERRFAPPQTLPNGSVLPSPVTTFIKVTYMYYYAAQSNLAHYEALIVESHADFAGKSYTNQLCECGSYLKDAVGSLTETMEYFSDVQNVENIPLCTLAFVATPLVNAALDAKLARSYEDMTLRRRHVDLLADIYRRLALLYNVTNYVAVGTNQILKLVYSLSQEVLLRENRSHLPGAGGPSAQMAKSANMNHSLKLGAGNRLATWPDLWICYPRAYLLISTSVDYSLSVGRLPHDNDIPEFLLNTPPDTPKVRLPWMTKTDLINPSDATGADFWCPSYCPPTRPLSIIRPQTDAMPMSSAIAGGPLVGMAKPPLQVPTLPGALWQDGAVYGNVYNYQTTPVTFDQGPINLDFLNQMPPTAVPFFQPSPNQVVSYDQVGHSGSIPTTIVGNELNHPGDFGQVYMRDDENQASNMWVLDYYNETAGNGPSMLYSLTYPHPANESNDDQTDSNDGSVYGVGQAPDMP
ncbi:hypothetical protein BJX68DRAFT_14041 [Aspergillus pseudodeflectus]|uniref:Zn(2)-C6 fungal-type domain-containing protein n=1 Tax=Aspergillus pseudodeflectus TaxID=176178 RepID=A0ABR4LBZ8_9EURO